MDVDYRIRLTYTLTDGGGSRTAYAPGLVRVIPPLLGVDRLPDRRLPGSVFQGVNFNDFAGSSITPLADTDGDRVGEFVIVSQFGKPGWDDWGQDGASVGEAYMIYGGTDFNGKEFKLNATGVQGPDGLPGLVFVGVPTLTSSPVPLSSDKAGISGVIAIPDQDEDGAPELVFGIPRANTVRDPGWLTKMQHFVRGGVVVVSSQDMFFPNRQAVWSDTGDRVIALSEVGQDFADSLAATPLLGRDPDNNDWGCMPLDSDGDGVPDDGNGNGVIGDQPCQTNNRDNCDDNCRFISNPRQEDDAHDFDGDGTNDLDVNGIGDACDPEMQPPPPADADGDGVLDGDDNCLNTRNVSQSDLDGDGVGDACEVTEGDGDMDGDGIPDRQDNCIGVVNPEQDDTDCDGVGDACTTMFGPDSDGDGALDPEDNCPFTPNPDQTDVDGDRLGDDCTRARSDCGDAPPNQVTVCSPPNHPRFKADSCLEEQPDHGIGFYPQLVEERMPAPDFTLSGFPIWYNNLLYTPWDGWNNAIPCECPPILVPENIRVDQSKASTAIVGGWRPAYNSLFCQLLGVYLSSGFYTNQSRRQYGCRILGEGMEDQFGASLSFVDDVLLVGAPNYSPSEIQEFVEPVPDTRVPTGKVYQIKMRNLAPGQARPYGYRHRSGDPQLDYDRNPGPRPYQYIVGKHEGSPVFDGMGYAYPSGDSTPFQPTYYVQNGSIRTRERIGYHIAGTADFNGDALGDVLIGAPDAFSETGGGDNSGALYLVYRRTSNLEGDWDLARMELDRHDPNRLHGVLIRGRPGDHLGHCVGFGADLDGDGTPEVLDLNSDRRADVVFGNHLHTAEGDPISGRGEVVILFGSPTLESPANGFRIQGGQPEQDLVANGLAVILKGEQPGDWAGYNVGYAGDFDGDGKADFLVSAPNAWPDLDGDGTADPEEAQAGKVYLIFGSNNFGGDMDGDGQVTVADRVLSLADVGTTKIKGLVFAGRHREDQLGGGERPAYDGVDPLGIGTTGMRARNVTWAGDVNNDGYDDILIGAPMADVGEQTNAGEVYLILGFPID